MNYSRIVSESVNIYTISLTWNHAKMFFLCENRTC